MKTFCKKRSTFHKKFFVPNQKYENTPDLTPIVLLFRHVLLQKLQESVGTEEFGGVGGGELLPHQGGVFFLSQPGSHGNGEAQLFLGGHPFGNVLCGGFSHGKLGAVFVCAVLGGDGGGQGEYLSVQEGHSQLQTAGHAHFIRLQQDVSHKPGVQVDVLHLGDGVHALQLVAVGLGYDMIKDASENQPFIVEADVAVEEGKVIVVDRKKMEEWERLKVRF